jgi:hypothetical protein
MKIKKRLIIISALFLMVVLYSSCASIYDTIVNVQRLKFKLGSVNGLKIANVPFNNKASISDFSLIEGMNLLTSFTSGKLPTNFTLNVLAKNPNDGTGGTKSTTALIKSLGWKLFIDDKELINGLINRQIEVPGVGQETTIPVDMSFDLLSFFRNNQYNDLMNLAFAIGGKNGSAARIKLKINPTISTIIGDISPGEFTVIDKEYRTE